MPCFEATVFLGMTLPVLLLMSMSVSHGSIQESSCHLHRTWVWMALILYYWFYITLGWGHILSNFYKAVQICNQWFGTCEASIPGLTQRVLYLLTWALSTTPQMSSHPFLVLRVLTLWMWFLEAEPKILQIFLIVKDRFFFIFKLWSMVQWHSFHTLRLWFCWWCKDSHFL